jgi:glucose/arabinose dehydrogenase
VRFVSIRLWLAAGAVASASLAVAALAQETASPRLVVVARGLERPVLATQAPGEPGRVYIVEQGGLVRVFEGGRLRQRPFLDLRGRVSTGNEQGLLGLAFGPDYVTRKRIYVNYTDAQGDTIVAEYQVKNAAASPASARRLLRVEQPYPNHNGGNIVLGPDRKLWVGLGDGGSGGDPEDRAQNPGTLLGKLFRLDPLRPSVKPTLVAIGLRNPWRYTFDRAKGDLWIGDVGQGDIEEIDVLRAGSKGLVNFGWDVFEGRRSFEDKPLGPGRLIGPVTEYDHDKGCSVTGGYVYRGTSVPSLRGRYLYGDYCSGTIWSLPARGGVPRAEPFTVSSLSSFGESLAGELYAVSQDGVVYRIVR